MDTNQEEIWKDIPEYEGLYQASNLGRIKMLYKEVTRPNRGIRVFPEKIMSTYKEVTGYLRIGLRKNKTQKKFSVHQLIAVTFLDHVACGLKLVINHKNFIKTDNRVENLEITTQRENTNRKHLKSSSKYVGVCFFKRDKKWKAQIHINGKRKHLGLFDNEYDAHLRYQEELKKK